MRRISAIVLAKTAASVLRLTGSGGAALPGLIAERFDPGILTALSHQCKDGVILVCGTNGKTTTARLIAAGLETRGALVHNRTGSNLIRGQISAFLNATSWTGKLNASQALLEVDEAVLPFTIKYTKPRFVVLHNLFRDQLDRYGEVDATAKKWIKAIKEELPPSSWLIVNADDPNLVNVVKQSGHRQVIYYGVEDQSLLSPEPTSAIDAYLSPSSGLPLKYTGYYLSHLGIYQDPSGELNRPSPLFSASAVKLSTVAGGVIFNLNYSGQVQTLTLPLPGLYNTYNALAAAAVLTKVGLEFDSLQAVFSKITGVFGRFESLTINSRAVTFCLIKNPVGATEVIRTIAAQAEKIELAIFANDNFADGQDVSWYWDTHFELIAPSCHSLLCSGTRAADMALRLLYAGVVKPVIIKESKAAFEQAISENKELPLYVLSTYTATIELQRILAQRGVKLAYWKE